MRRTLHATTLAGLMIALPAMAQDNQQGEYADALRRMIVETAAGSCPEDLMADGLLAACLQQLAQMSAGLASLGAVEAMTFVGAEETPNGRVETYSVRFASGQTLNWGIGGQQDSKYTVAYAGGA
ncbi:hypothetical protein [Brevundimonas bacteroides]|uniref:hypothetical protein n=1 Tax=Brevundimonas bacteroides TaxID=74311 RepID=UPI000496D2B5|nr:hypothetical protein [Brevundimonas bacteroides]